MSEKISETNTKENEKKSFGVVYAFCSYKDNLLLQLRLKLRALLE